VGFVSFYSVIVGLKRSKEDQRDNPTMYVQLVHLSVNNGLQNIISETTVPNSMKLHSNVCWVTFHKNTRHHDWPTTTTTKWLV